MTNKAEQNYINTKELARVLKEELQGDYKLYEIEDILDALSVTIPNLVLQGNKVRLGNFGTFRSKVRKESPVGGALGAAMIAAGKCAVTPARTKIEFDPSISVKEAFASL